MKNNYSKNNRCKCGKEIINRATFCKSCVAKKRYVEKLSSISIIKIGEESSNYKNGKTLISYYCKSCNKLISLTSGLYGNGLCGKCAMNLLHNTEKWRETISIIMKEKFKNSENHPNWQGGITVDPYSLEWTDELRKKVRIRDNYICQICSMTQEEHLIRYGCVLHVHHIDYNKQNCIDTNLITLCHKHHMETNSNRDYWIKNLNDMITHKKDKNEYRETCISQT